MRADARYDSLIQYYADQNGLDWRRIKRQLIAESSLDPKAVSPVGAQGLAQFMPATWTEWGEGDPFNPEDAIRACCRYMAHLFGRFGEIPDEVERWKFAVAAYNAGRGNINKCLGEARKACGLPLNFYSWDRAGRVGGPWQEWEFAKRFLSLITGTHALETINYVERVMGHA